MSYYKKIYRLHLRGRASLRGGEDCTTQDYFAIAIKKVYLMNKIKVVENLIRQ